MAKAVKGSQFHLQEYVEKHQEKLNNSILTSSSSLLVFADAAKDLQWISPIKETKYEEFRDDFLNPFFEDDLGLIEAYKIIRQCWPSRGPVWDGLAIVHGKNNQKGLILVEAKAYPEETLSKMKAESETSKKLIISSLEMTKQAFGSTSAIDPWTNQYYQLANRLCFLTLLNTKINIPTWLFLVNFTGDSNHKTTSLRDWRNHYSDVFDILQVKADEALLNKVVPVFLPAII